MSATNPTPTAALAEGDLVAIPAPAGFRMAVVRDVGEPRDGRVRLTCDVFLDADELVDVVWAKAVAR